MPKKPVAKTKSKVVSRKKTVAKKKLDQPAKPAPIQPKKPSSRKSIHVVNLKNPYNHLFEEAVPLRADVDRPVPKPTPTLKPIPFAQNLSTKSKIFGVNFINDQSLSAKKSTTADSDISQHQDVEDIFAPPENVEFLNFNFPRNWPKKIAAFAIGAVILILPFQALTYYQELQHTKDKILLFTNEAIESLISGQQSAANLDLDQANFQFDQAKVNFALAQKQINDLNILTEEILKLLPSQGESVQTGLTLLEAGEIIAETGQILINGGQNFIAGGNLADYYQSLVGFESDLALAINKFNQAKIKIEQIEPKDLPEQHRQTFQNVLAALPQIKTGLTDLYTINKVLLKILGDEQWQRYLIIFLNNNELRGGGGFMGSFGLIDIDRGEIKNLEIPGGGTYDLQGQLQPKVISPQPLHLINPRWEFQDANWWPDFPTTAKKIQWFYQNAGGPSVDGVITITSTLIERLLEILGPISMPEYGRDITSENFVLETQKIVELEYDREENRPKQFIADLAPKLLTAVFNAENEAAKNMFELFKTGLNEKHLLVYFNDEKIQNIVSDFGWTGELRPASGDYLSVVHSNIAGGKTDGVIKETIEHTAEVQADGSIINTVKLIRRHTGIPGENIFTGVQNNSYVRFYVPLGSTLIEAQGFNQPADNLFKQPNKDYQADSDLLSIESDKIKDEVSGTDIYKENGKTVFGNWLQLKAGEVGQALIKYRLPFKLALEGENTFYYSLLAQKQAGSLGSELKSYLKLNDQLKPLAKFPADLPSDEAGVSYSSVLRTDRFYGVVLIAERSEYPPLFYYLLP